MRIIKIELAKVVTIHQEKIKIIKQSECTAAQTSNVQRFLERRQPPHFRAGSNTQYINGFWIYFWKTTRLSSRCSQSLFRRPRFYNPHYGAFTNLHISKNRGIGRFRFQYINRLCVLVATLEQIKPLFQIEFAIGRKLQSFQFRSINLRAAQMERAVARKAARNATDPVCFGNAAKVQSEPWERERVLKSSLSIRVPQFDLAACTAKTARINGASLGCSLSTMSWCISSFHPQLQNQDGSLGLISSRGDATTDGLGAIFNQPRRSLWTFSPQTSASCQESEAAPALYISSVCNMGQQNAAVIERVPSLTAAQTSNVQRFLERRQPPHFRAGSNTQYINGFWIYFWKTTRLSSRCSQSLFRRPRFYNPHYGAFTNLHISKNRGIGRFRFQYINRLCVLVATLEQIKPLFQTEFAIGRKLQSFQFRSINLRAAQMERAVARKAARNATDPVCFGNAAKVQSEPWERERVLKSSLSIRVPQFDLAACTAKTARINGASLGCSLSTMSWCISSFHPQLQNQDGSLGLISSRGDATTDGLGAIFNQPRRSLWTFSPQTSASCQESEAAPALYISSVCNMGQQKAAVIERVPSLTAAQTSNVQRFLERRQPPHFRAGSNTQYINGFWIYFWKTTRLSSRCSQSLFSADMFYNPHYAAHQFILQTEDRPFRFQYINRLCVLVATLEQINVVLTEFAIGRKLLKFQFQFRLQFTLGPNGKSVAENSKEHTDTSLFGNAAKVQSEPGKRERVLKIQSVYTRAAVQLAACTQNC
ncbi:Hypothetical_protein [Hexamita inflata]|uniref:Hypothetical_protein n=1 Tax=Hexamita inflata TaxID=28002 RepID=A0AA86QTC3_9EUKA|nr:Hypothetical protein HINF_LOCUS51313 [Hexamita inflata]